MGSVAGALTLDAGVGLLGGDGKKVCEKDGDNKLCSTKGITCGDGKTLSKGQLLFVRPSAAIELAGSCAVGTSGAEAGIEIKVTLLEIKVPITLEANMGGTVGASSTSLQLQIGAGAGSISAYAEVWVAGREDWEIFSWDGAETTYPDEGYFLGDYSDKVGIPKREFKMKDPLETECLVVLYPVTGGKGGDVNKRYALQTGCGSVSSTTCIQKENSLPQDVQDSTKSARTFGACDFVEFVDDDYGDASYGDSNSFWIGGVDYNNLPDDIESDVFKLGITTTPTGQYNNRWTRKDCCAFASFSSPNHVGKEWFQFDCGTADASNTYNAGEDNAWGDNDLDLDSALFASSCSGVNLKEQDGNQNWFTSKDVGDMAGMPDDYVDDVYRVVLSIGSAEELLDVSTAAKVKVTKDEKKGTFTLSKAAREKRDKPSGCWTCWPALKKAKGDASKSKSDKVELLGTSSDKPGTGEAKKNKHPTYSLRGKETEPPNECGKYEEDKKKRQYGIRVDQGCKRTDRGPLRAKQEAKAKLQTIREVCEGCGLYFDAGSEKQKNCKSECKEKMHHVTFAMLRKEQKVPMCSDECLFGDDIFGKLLK